MEALVISLAAGPFAPHKEVFMRTRALAIAAAMALFAFPVSTSAQTFEIGPGGFRYSESRSGAGSQQCEELRLACENKDALGERGEGNCRRYRNTCQRVSLRQMCRDLRNACLYKNELGERGEGNCRRYRDTCRRGYSYSRTTYY